MAYGLIYQLEFDALKLNPVQPYRTLIYKKKFTGTPSSLTGAAQPVIQQWQTDEPTATIKGSNLQVSFLNSGLTPLSAFFSTEDDTFKVEHYWGTQLLFTGYLVQSDSTEIQIDITHEVQLSFTDNLGLLKDVPFNQANMLVGNKRVINYITYVLADTPTVQGYISIATITSGILVGDTLVLEGTLDPGVYTVVNVVVAALVTFIYVAEPLLYTDNSGGPYEITIYTPADLTTRLPLTKFIEVCLKSTNLLLNTNVYNNLVVQGGATGRILEDVFLTGETFLSGDTWNDCYRVLEIILNRYKCSLFQSDGVWNIIRWTELRYSDNDVPGVVYNSDMVYQEAINGLQIFDYGTGTIETGLLGSILRPYKFDKETFNYKQPANLLRNADMQHLGKIINTYISGTNTITNYALPDWFDGPFSPHPARRIMVSRDTATGTENSRLIVLSGLTGDDARSAKSTAIEVQGGDSCKYGFTFKTNDSQAGPIFLLIGVLLFDGTNNWYLQNDGGWSSSVGPGFRYNIPAGGNTNQWNSVDVDINNLPATGYLFVFLNHPHNTGSPSNETYTRSITFEYIPVINSSTKIIGQTHTDIQPPTINNRNEEEVFIDDAPRNSINGCTFLSSFTGLLQNKTSLWNRAGFTEVLRVGQITTFEELFYRRAPREKFEGNLLNLVQPGVYKYTGDMFFANVDIPPIVHFINIPGLPVILAVGQQFTISGSGVNDGTYISLGYDPVNLPATAIMVADSLTLGGPVNATITLTDYPIHLSMLRVIKYAQSSSLNFIFGMLSINFRKNQANGTFTEQWKDGEADADLVQNYIFKYLYDTR